MTGGRKSQKGRSEQRCGLRRDLHVMIDRRSEVEIGSVAQFYSSDVNYAPARFEKDSVALRELLGERGVLA
jgi:hypothetical protein